MERERVFDFVWFKFCSSFPLPPPPPPSKRTHAPAGVRTRVFTSPLTRCGRVTDWPLSYRCVVFGKKRKLQDVFPLFPWIFDLPTRLPPLRRGASASQRSAFNRISRALRRAGRGGIADVGSFLTRGNDVFFLLGPLFCFTQRHCQ